MAVLFANNAATRLASTVATGSTSFSVTAGDGTKFPSPSGGDWFPVTLIKSTGAIEIMRCTSRTGDVLTVTRGQEGTAAQAFAVGDRVELRLTAAVLGQFIQDYLFSDYGKDLVDSTDAADARTLLELVKTISTSDTNVGRMLKVGDFGIGAAADTLVLPTTTQTDATTDFNSITNPGWFNKLLGTGVAGSRNANHPDGTTAAAVGNGVSDYYWILVAKHSNGRLIQVAIPYGVNTTDNTNATVKFRFLVGSTWTAWKALMTENMTKAFNEAPPVTMASASTMAIGAAMANTINVSGAITITAFDAIAAGAKRTLVFQGASVLTHNATSLILPGGANITPAAGDVAEFLSLGGGNWRCIDYQVAQSSPTASQYLHVRDEKASGTNGGAFTSGAWRTRDLNTVVGNTITGASLASNQITLPAGTYEVEGGAPHYQSASGSVTQAKARLYSVTGAVQLATGPHTQINGTSAASQPLSTVRGRFTLSATSVVELQHYATQTKNTDGFGSAISIASVNEIYSDIVIRRIG